MKFMKKIWKSRNTKNRAGSHGIITVFVTLMMVPVVAITGIMVDISRLNLYSSQAVMAADTYGDAVLSEFDNLLKELYGLFSVTQNKEGLEAINKLAETVGYSFNPTGDGKTLEGFMPYKDTDVKLSYEKIENASLANNNVLMTQISDFMKYRIAEEIMDENGILSSLKEFDHMDADMKASKTRTEITDSSQKILGKIQDYYETLKKIAAYPEYIDGLAEKFKEYSGKLREAVSTDEYEKYVYYKMHKEEIDAVLKEFGESKDAEESEYEKDNSWLEGDWLGFMPFDINSLETLSPDESEDDEDLAEKVELYDKYKDFDIEEYLKNLEQELLQYERALTDHSNDTINFDNAGKIIDDLQKKTTELEKSLQTLKEQVSDLKKQLENCSDDIRDGIKKEIEDLDKILKYSDEFREVYNLIEPVNGDKEKNFNNKKDFDREVELLSQIRIQILDGNIQYNDDYWKKQIILQWYDFMDDKAELYRFLQEICESGDGRTGDKKAGEKETKRADKFKKEAKKELNKDEKTTARNIPDGIAAELQTGGTQGSVPDFTSFFSDGLSFKNLAGVGEKALDKFLVTSYDFGMFSSRVSGVKPPDADDSDVDSYGDVSLTGFEMSPDINYLYGAELEYLLGGYNKSVSNLNYSRNVICGVRETMNFISSYKIPEVNEAISAIADAAAAAVAASAVGAPAAPLVRVAVSGSLRLAFASIETAEDWKELKERNKVTFFKTELGDLSAFETVKDLLKIEIEESEPGSDLGLSYEDYMFVLLCVFTDANTLLSRTSNLITLNMNQAKNRGNEWSSLSFKMQNTVTAVKTTCQVKADFVVLPDNFAEMFYSGTDTESQIERLENQYFGYSVIRGY